MSLTRVSVLLLAPMAFGMALAFAQQTPAPAPDSSPETTAQLLEQLKAQDARLKELEAQVAKLRQRSPPRQRKLRPLHPLLRAWLQWPQRLQQTQRP